MITLRHLVANGIAGSCAIVVLGQFGNRTHAQNATQPLNAMHSCSSPQVIPLAGTEPAPKLFIDPPLAEPLASRGVVVIQYCAENMRIVPVFGPGALTASPRVGHVHVRLDGAPWVWADASGTPVILQGLEPGPHSVQLELVNANHQVVDKGSISFEVPRR